MLYLCNQESINSAVWRRPVGAGTAPDGFTATSGHAERLGRRASFRYTACGSPSVVQEKESSTGNVQTDSLAKRPPRRGSQALHPIQGRRSTIRSSDVSSSWEMIGAARGDPNSTTKALGRNQNEQRKIPEKKQMRGWRWCGKARPRPGLDIGELSV